MKIRFLGTNGWYDINIGNTISTFIKVTRRIFPDTVAAMDDMEIEI